MSEGYIALITAGMALAGVFISALIGYIGKKKESNLDQKATDQKLQSQLRNELSEDRNIFKQEAEKFRKLYYEVLEENSKLKIQMIELTEKIDRLEQVVKDLEVKLENHHG